MIVGYLTTVFFFWSPEKSLMFQVYNIHMNEKDIFMSMKAHTFYAFIIFIGFFFDDMALGCWIFAQH